MDTVRSRTVTKNSMNVGHKPVQVWNRERCCWHVNNSIRELSLNDRAQPPRDVFLPSAALPCFPSHSRGRRELLLFSNLPSSLIQDHQQEVLLLQYSLMFRTRLTSPLHYFNIQSLRLIIPLLSKAWFVPLRVSCSHFSLGQRDRRWNETRRGAQEWRGKMKRIGGDKQETFSEKRWKKNKGEEKTKG